MTFFQPRMSPTPGAMSSSASAHAAASSAKGQVRLLKSEIERLLMITEALWSILKEKYQFITDVRGRGLLLAVEFSSDIGQSLLTDCLNNGLLVNRVKPNALRLMPPLIIGKDEVDEAVDILDKALSNIVS